MDIYRAVFQAKPEEIDRTRSYFIDTHSQELYDQLIEPYLKDGVPGFLFHAPENRLVWWFMDQLIRYKAWKSGEEYQPPAMFLAYVEHPVPTVDCTICGVTVREQGAYPDQDSGQPICLICHKKQADQRVQKWLDGFDKHP